MAYIQLNGQIFGGEKCKGKGNVEINFDYAFFLENIKIKLGTYAPQLPGPYQAKGAQKYLASQSSSGEGSPK